MIGGSWMVKNNLQKIMCDRNLTYAELSRRSGVSNSTLFRIANYESDPRQSTMIAISKALEMDTGEVFFIEWR